MDDDRKDLPQEQLTWITSYLDQLEAQGFFSESLSSDIQAILN